MDIASITAYISFLLIAYVFYRILKNPKYHLSCRAPFILLVATGLQIIFLPSFPASELLEDAILLCGTKYDASNSLCRGYHAFRIAMKCLLGMHVVVWCWLVASVTGKIARMEKVKEDEETGLSVSHGV
jgi:hypothetical protein